MLKSMTAFAKAKCSFKDVEIAVEIQSVNKKHLDLHIKLPAECTFYDPLIREILSKQILRGHIHASIQVNFLSTFAVKVVANTSFAKELHAASLTLAQALDVPEVSQERIFFHILKEKGVLQASFEVESDDFEEKLKSTLNMALVDLDKMKEREGERIALEFSARLASLCKIREEIALHSSDVKAKFYKRLTDLLGELVGSNREDERVAKEIAFMADKVDIAEELSRFGFHLEHFASEMQTKKSGKVLEFILQELNREITTIGAKCQDVRISKVVIDAKAELERMREQVQNVE